MSNTYAEEEKQKDILRLRTLLQGFPVFVSNYFRGIASYTSPKTRLGYAYDLEKFFLFLTESHDHFLHKDKKEITLGDFQIITAEDLEIYLEYLTLYEKRSDSGELVLLQNDEKGKARKIAAVRSLFKYLYKNRKLPANPAELVESPKIHQKNITRLEIDEVARLLDEVESGEHLTKRQKKWHSYNQKRDLALVSLLLGTGIRVSECAGIDIHHIDFNINGIQITRKGGNQVVIYFGPEVREALLDYWQLRKTLVPVEGHEDAFFLSLQMRRISVRAIQNLVKKYASIITKRKNISPHKLRSTYGTNLYRETGDIYLVADVLGHKDVNTTRKHYAQMDDERRRQAAKYVKLRNE